MALDYFNQCDRWRIGNDEGERLWHLMMANSEPIANEVMKKAADLYQLLDEEETLEDFMADDEGSACYRSGFEGVTVLFVQSSGFEFIFTEDGKSPEELIRNNLENENSSLRL